MCAVLAAASTLDRLSLTSEEVEQNAAGIIERRLHDAGPAPYSLCEARLSQAEYKWLLAWASTVVPGAFQAWSSQRQGYAGLVFLALLAEWNRRESAGDTVWQGVSTLFNDQDTQDYLFRAKNGENARQLVRKAADRYRLRHAFGADENRVQPYYLTIQLQYGFCRQQISRVTDWLCGLPPTEAMYRILALTGRQRSRSFQRLMADLRHYRRDYLTEFVVRRQLEQNHWILPEWIPALLEAARGSCMSTGGDEEEETEPELASHVTLKWAPECGPIVRLRLEDLRGRFGRAADRYQLRCGGELLATWLRQPAEASNSALDYRVDVRQVDLPARTPDLILHLEDEAGEIVATQAVPIWDPTEDVQSLQFGSRPGEQRHSWQVGKEVAVLVQRGYLPSKEPEEWFLTGYGTPFERRWLRYISAPEELRVQDDHKRVAWEAVTRPVPTWAKSVRVQVVPEHEPLALGERFWIEIGA